MNHKKYLSDTLQEAVDGKLDYNQFEDNFYACYITKVSDEDLSEQDHDYFTEIQEKFEYTGVEPPKEDREHGYISYKEFVDWLKNKLENVSK
ncbi:MAG: hypothetical protein HOE19_04130 [Candidatus Komeilibacteria bacterium]|jgi:hypothetical protein|nr:hypothetical protein [Candidatus Komeilibacteria bacterium]MBT4447862.1 hypothetical protein [Candidatus Komeilibacteria bacterium]